MTGPRDSEKDQEGISQPVSSSDGTDMRLVFLILIIINIPHCPAPHLTMTVIVCEMASVTKSCHRFSINSLLTTMKHSRMTHRRPQPAQKSNISSLKAIMNQGRVPLSQYINHNAKPITPTPAHYIDKFKAMLGQPVSHRDNVTLPQPQRSSAHLHGHDGHHSRETEHRYTREKGEYNYKARSRSSVGHRKALKANNEMQGERYEVSHRVTHTQQEASETVQPMVLPRCLKQVRKETVNYAKFKQILDVGMGGGVFDLGEALGCGANAVVRVAHQRGNNGAVFAIKVYQKYKLIEPIKMKRVFKEIDLLSKLNHPNIIGIGNCYEDKRQIHILFEYIHNAETMQDYIRSRAYNLPLSQRQNITQSLISAVAYLHSRNISHRDIKADNVMIGQQGEVKLIDFGFATRGSKSEVHCGTPNYMAPQLFGKKNAYDPFKVDMWALGVLIYYLHEGCHPFRGYNEKDLARNINAGAFSFSKTPVCTRQLIQRLLSVDPQQRPSASQITA